MYFLTWVDSIGVPVIMGSPFTRCELLFYYTYSPDPVYVRGD
jgi:hypothetical protein